MKSAAIASQLVFMLIGVVLLWRHVISPHARANPLPVRMAPWPAAMPELLTYILHGLAGAFLGSFAVGLAAKSFALSPDELSIAATGALHVGALVGLALAMHSNPVARPNFTQGASVFRAGVATFLMAMPIVFVANHAWLGVLALFGVDVERQPAVELVERLGTSPWLFAFVFSAIIVAPVAEELLFRAGLFRALRSRLRRSAALVVPSLLFAAIHLHLPSYVPLAVLGVIFSLAYEHTGAIGTSMVAHAAFNLNNLLMLLAGADT